MMRKSTAISDEGGGDDFGDVMTRHIRLTNYYVLVAAYRFLLATYYLLTRVTTYCLLLTACYLQLGSYFLLRTTYCLLVAAGLLTNY